MLRARIAAFAVLLSLALPASADATYHKPKIIYRTRIVYRTKIVVPTSCLFAVNVGAELINRQRQVLASGGQGFEVWFATLQAAAAELDQLTVTFTSSAKECREVAMQYHP
jgi:hypothetical protein